MIRLGLMLWFGLAFAWPATSNAARCGDGAYCKEACARAYPWPLKTHEDRSHCRTRCTRCGRVAHYTRGSLHVYTMGAGVKIKLDSIVGTADSRQCVRIVTFGKDGRPDGRNTGRLYSNGIGFGANGEKQVRRSGCYELKPLIGAATVKYTANQSPWTILMYSSDTQAAEVLHIGLDDGTVRFAIQPKYKNAQGALVDFLMTHYRMFLDEIVR